MIAMNIRQKDVLNCLPLLASVLGDQYGVEVRIGGREAYTDGKVIHIPALPLDCDAETLAMARGFADHEAGHIRHTDFIAMKAASLDAVTFNLFNSLEDWRVEKRLSAIFPGCRQNLNRLIRKFFVEETGARAGARTPALAVLFYVLLTVRAWDVQEVTPRRMAARDALQREYSGLAEMIDAVLVKVRIHCPDTASAIGYARQLAACIRQWEPQAKGDSPQGKNGESQCKEDENPAQSGETFTRDFEYDADSEQSDSSCQEERADRSASQTDAERNQSGRTACVRKQELEDLFTADPQNLPRNLGDLLAEVLTAAKLQEQMGGMEVAVCGVRHVLPLGSEEKTEALRSGNALRQRLQGLLQAQALRRCTIGRRGKLHPASLHRLCVGNPRVFRRESIQPGLNTAVHILLDCSGSMDGKPMLLARQACFAVAGALEDIRGVNPAVTAFPAVSAKPSVFPLVRHGEKVTENFGITASGGTPLAPALWWVLQRLCSLEEERKIILILTDGTPDAVTPCHDALKQAERLGVEVYGIGIKSNAVNQLLPQHSRVIADLPELAPAMFEMLQAALLKGDGHDRTA